MELNDDAGALRATNNKGLQPAMDFILEHNDDPIPDATSGAAATSSAQPHSEPIVIDEEEDEDTAALHAAYGLKPGDVSQTDSGAGVEARVSSPSFFPFDDSWLFLHVTTVLEHQMFRVREDIQNYSARELPRGEEWARSVRGVHGGGGFSD